MHIKTELILPADFQRRIQCPLCLSVYESRGEVFLKVDMCVFAGKTVTSGQGRGG